MMALLAAAGPGPHSTRQSAAKFPVGGFCPMAWTPPKNGREESWHPTLVGFGLKKSENHWPGGQLPRSALLTSRQSPSGHCGDLSSTPGPTHAMPGACHLTPTALEQGTLQLGLSPRQNLEAGPSHEG